MNLEVIRIRVLKDTPFDKAGELLTIQSWRNKYNYMFTKSVTDEEIVRYLRQERECFLKSERELMGTGQWFEVIEKEEELPNYFIFDGLYYTKEMDGMFHMWTSSDHHAMAKSQKGDPKILPLKLISIEQAKGLLKLATFRQYVLYCGTTVNRKL